MGRQLQSCAYCGKLLGEDSNSLYFCDYQCQQQWGIRNAIALHHPESAWDYAVVRDRRAASDE